MHQISLSFLFSPLISPASVSVCLFLVCHAHILTLPIPPGTFLSPIAFVNVLLLGEISSGTVESH